MRDTGGGKDDTNLCRTSENIQKTPVCRHEFQTPTCQNDPQQFHSLYSLSEAITTQLSHHTTPF